MNKKRFNSLFVFLMLTISGGFLDASNWDIYSLDKNVFVGNIIFPKDIKNLPQVSLYRRGIKIKTENEASNKKIQFTISEDKSCRKFYMLITKTVTPDIEENVVKYLKISPNQNYNLYELTIFTNQESAINPINKKEEIKETYSWQIQQKRINKEGIIPDDTLIVIFNPDYIDKLEGGSNLELPKIIIKKDILKQAGSEEKLTDETNELLLSSLDLKILHSNPASEVKPEYKKRLVVAMANPD